MIVNWAQKLKDLGVDALRGGAYKPCTYPVKKSVGNWKEGLREDGLKFLISAREESGLPIVSEIMDARQINTLSMDAIDIIQVGTRNFQNYSLLDELGKLDKIILLKEVPVVLLMKFLELLKEYSQAVMKKLLYV